MSLSALESAHLFITLGVLLCAAYGGGRLFAALRQPPVIGEILAGLVLGPTVFGWIAPHAERWLLPATGTTANALAALYQLGMLFLIFVTGAELRGSALPGERRTVGGIAVVGLALPLAFGLAGAWVLDPGRFSGVDGTRTTFMLTFSMAIAVTSIPVISRIMLDLGILRTAFARVVLSVAVAEDVVLYVVLGVVLALARSSSPSFGLWSALHEKSSSLAGLYYCAATLVFFVVFFALARPAYAFATTPRRASTPVATMRPVAAEIALMLVGVVLCSLLGIDQVFGALVAGVCVGRVRHRADAAAQSGEQGSGAAELPGRTAVRDVSLSFFIPIYFVIVGIDLDLRHYFDFYFFLWFLPMACVVKSVSVWLGARFAGQSRRDAVDFAMAMNARGGPGILLATVTLGAGVINERFFTSLVLLSVITSQFAGMWLSGRRAEIAAATPSELVLATTAQPR
jgi:Kef-type K+ transport system membrane component KefB